MYNLTYHHADQILRSSQGHPLFIGDAAAAEDLEWLQSNNISTVISVVSGFNFTYELPIRQIKYDLEDKKTQNISAYFDKAASEIDKYLKNAGVLVHCGAGISRSPTLVIAYLIKFKGMGFLQALKFLKTKRPQVCPNLGFELQLKSYEKVHHNSGNIFILSSKKKEKKQLPEIVKYQPMATFNKSFHKDFETKGNFLLSKSLKPVERKEMKEIDYLRKMAEFRFGITNMSRWKMLNPKTQEFKKVINL